MTELIIRRRDAARTGRGRLRHAVMEAGVVLSLTFAIVAVICAFGLDGAGASELHAVAGEAGGQMTMGVVLLSIFAGMCVLTTFMLRHTISRTPQLSPVRRRPREG
ncbi:hypothetical protein MWN34_07510 [Ancylobacter sp. 6x-1]|uniref:Uncharacterized protein n=1 Tax=Ancylobacter crimeensis TaxID=2579147 RepID=A0ABT0DA38_9HYPH|nr:hypothetical protein [Ancylobacter crimeensis]MCK0196759.1 hypothetical protein [Ancylobacter crimeensis]